MLIESALLTKTSGSLGGIVGSHNRGGRYFRARTVPTNPNTARQAQIRGILGDLVNEWTSTLTATQQNSWRTYADGTPVSNRIGAAIKLTGQNMYIRFNAPVSQGILTGQTMNTAKTLTAPLILNTGEPIADVTDDDDISLQLSFDAGTGELSGNLLLAAPASADGDIFLYWGRAVNSNRRFYKGPYQLAHITTISQGNDTEALSAITTDPTEWARDADISVGQFVPIRLTIAYIDGRYSQAFEAIVEIVAAA